MQNPYHVLGVSKDADAETIKKAYKKLARKYHPDVSTDAKATERFKAVNEAWEILGDEQKRKLYDQFGDAGLKGGARGPGGPRGAPHGFTASYTTGYGSEPFDMDDLLGSLFGAHGRGRRPAHGADIRTTLTINPLLAFTGGPTTFQMQSGSGGSMQPIKLTVPAGVKTGTTLRLAGKGSPPPGGGPAGDLHIRLTVPDHPLIRRIDNDLELDVPVTVLEALEGAHVTVPTPTGDVKVRIPPGSQTGRKLRLRGRGVQTKTPGDLYLVIRPTIPMSDDPEVLEAARRLAKAHTTSVRDGLKL